MSGGIDRTPAPRAIVEAPATQGMIDFLSVNASVEASIVNGQIIVTVKVMHGEAAYTWDEQEIAMPLRK